LKVLVFSEQRSAVKQVSFLAERPHPFEEMRWPPPALQASKSRKIEESKQPRLFEAMQQAPAPAWQEPVWAAQASPA
jgi:hypothetical protein